METAAAGMASLRGLVIKKELADDFSYPTESSFSAQSPSTANGMVSEYCTAKLKWGQTENCTCEFSTKRLKTSNIVEEGEGYTIEINPSWKEELSDFSQCETGSGHRLIKPELDLYTNTESTCMESDKGTKMLKQPRVNEIPEGTPSSNSILPAISREAPVADSILTTISQAATASNVLSTTSQASKDSSVFRESSSPLRLLSDKDPTCVSPGEDLHFSEDSCIIGMFDSAVGRDGQSKVPLHENTRTSDKHLLKTKVSKKKSTKFLKNGVTSDDLYKKFLLSSIRCNESYIGLEKFKQKKMKLEIELLKMQIQQLESESCCEQDT